jgi:hypothetical protein
LKPSVGDCKSFAHKFNGQPLCHWPHTKNAKGAPQAAAAAAAFASPAVWRYSACIASDDLVRCVTYPHSFLVHANYILLPPSSQLEYLTQCYDTIIKYLFKCYLHLTCTGKPVPNLAPSNALYHSAIICKGAGRCPLPLCNHMQGSWKMSSTTLQSYARELEDVTYPDWHAAAVGRGGRSRELHPTMAE